jgi:hypothetical protein
VNEVERLATSLVIQVSTWIREAEHGQMPEPFVVRVAFASAEDEMALAGGGVAGIGFSPDITDPAPMSHAEGAS